MIGRRMFCACMAGALACRASAQAPPASVQAPPASVQAPPASAGPAGAALIDDLVAANRILFDQGVVDGFGHISVRHDREPTRFLLSRSMAPALVTAADIMEFDLDGTPVDARGRTPYLERFIHGEILRLHPEVMAVVHSHSPAVIPFGVTNVALRPLYHMSSFLGAGAPVFDIRSVGGDATDMLIRNRALGRGLAEQLGAHPVLLMRGHGSVAVGRGIREVVFRAVYTEVNARMEGEALRLGEVTFLNEQEAAAATVTNAGLVDRPWELWRKRAMGG